MIYYICRSAIRQAVYWLAGVRIAARHLCAQLSNLLPGLLLLSCASPAPATAGGLLRGWSEQSKEALFVCGVVFCVALCAGLMAWVVLDTLRMLDKMNAEVDFLINKSTEVRNFTSAHLSNSSEVDWAKLGTRKGEAGYQELSKGAKKSGPGTTEGGADVQ